jgi:hypothetical protein
MKLKKIIAVVVKIIAWLASTVMIIYVAMKLRTGYLIALNPIAKGSFEGKYRVGVFDKVAVILLGIALLSFSIVFERLFETSRGPAQLGKRFARIAGVSGLLLFLAQGLAFVGAGVAQSGFLGWVLFFLPAVAGVALLVMSYFFGNPGAPWTDDEEDTFV